MSALAAMADYGACAREWVHMATQHRLARPADHLGAVFSFRDGTRSRVFRETVAVGATTADPVLLVIAFRLAFLDDLEPLHAGFRRECLIHTPLFAGFPGFRSKLWLDDEDTRIYRGRVPVGRSDGRGWPMRRGWSGCSRRSRTGERRGTISCRDCVERTSCSTRTSPTGGEQDGWWRLAHRAPWRVVLGGSPAPQASGYRRCANSCRTNSPARRRMRWASRCSWVVTGAGRTRRRSRA